MTNRPGSRKECAFGSDDADRLRELHEATRDLMDATTRDGVAEIATETARDVLGLGVNAVFFREGDRLVGAAATDAVYDLFGAIPVLRSGDSMGWRVYERGEAVAYDDIRDAELMQNPETPMRSELMLPLGEHGLFVAGTTTPAEFSDGHVSLAKVFAANVEAALDRAEREERLTQQNDRLDRFASVVSHDLLNPLNVAQGRLELARATCDSDHLDDVAGAHDRIAELLEDLLALAREGAAVEETEPVALDAVVAESRTDVPGELDVAVESAAAVADDVEVTDAAEWTVEADRGRLRELLSNLLANADDHGASAVRVGRLADDAGFFVADDGPGIDPEARERVFEHGYTTTDAGSGFGLAIVRDIAQSHGWTVTATESEAGGARIEVRTGR